jgi:DNA-binding transcriptional regulator YiaG
MSTIDDLIAQKMAELTWDGSRLRAAMRFFRITQVELAEALGVSKGSVSWWTSSRSCPPAHCMAEVERLIEQANELKEGGLHEE